MSCSFAFVDKSLTRLRYLKTGYSFYDFICITNLHVNRLGSRESYIRIDRKQYKFLCRGSLVGC